MKKVPSVGFATGAPMLGVYLLLSWKFFFPIKQR